MILDQETIELGQKIWNYHQLHQMLEKADCILVLGSHDTRVARRGAQLVLDGFAPLVVFSGGLGRLTEGVWKETEADTFARIALEMGVPKEKIFIENRSTNTGENISLTYELFLKNNLAVRKIILVQKPYMERRAYATFMKQWPGPPVEVMVTSPQISFQEYPNEHISMEEVIHILVGDLHRIDIYARRGFQIPQHIPPDVWEAYHMLVKKGFTDHLVGQ
jgi:uncharacterized SAM-binding protein YcdF (DUF218 family)